MSTKSEQAFETLSDIVLPSVNESDLSDEAVMRRFVAKVITQTVEREAQLAERENSLSQIRAQARQQSIDLMKTLRILDN